MKTLFLAPESPDPAHGGGPMRSACMLEWLARRSEVYALVFSPPGPRLRAQCRRVEVVELPFHSRRPWSRAWRNVRRAARGVSPLVDRFFCEEARAPLNRLLAEGPFDLAVFEHFWSAPWIRQVRPHCRTAILNLHNREPEFCSAMGGPLAGWFARAAERWESDLLPLFDQVWDTGRVPTGLPWRPLPETEREFDLAFSGTLAYPPNRDALNWFFARIWPQIADRLPKVRCVIIGKNPEAVPCVAARDPRVMVTGPVEDALEWLGRARVAVVPLRRGAGMSVKIAEAWQAGCAVVATPVGARGYDAPESLAMAETPAQFSATVLGLLADEESCRRLGEAGRRRWEKDYSWTAVHQRMDKQWGRSPDLPALHSEASVCE